jgi:hypothetical protein
MSGRRLFVLLTAPVYVFLGWATGGMFAPHENVALAFAIALVLAGTASLVLYSTQGAAESKMQSFYLGCYAISLTVFVGATLARAFRLI